MRNFFTSRGLLHCCTTSRSSLTIYASYASNHKKQRLPGGVRRRKTSDGRQENSPPELGDKLNVDRIKQFGQESKPAQRSSPLTLGSSAGDVPEKRKNPELYSSLKGVPHNASTHSEAAPAADSIVQRHLPSHDSQTLPPASPENSSAISYLISSPSSITDAPAVQPPQRESKSRGQERQHEQQLQQRSPARERPSCPSPPPLPCKPEVLAPAGGWPQLRAAVENGADAVYFGLEDFNARARAANFSYDELPEVMSYLHARGVKGFVALNVLVFDEELPALESRVRSMAEAGVDAVIVQDWGVVSLLRRVAPCLPVHGSTQMSITSAEGAEWAAGLGVERVVVGRELSVREIGKVRDGLAASSTSTSTSSTAPPAEIEAFVHGAMCVSYSGQCFSSEAWGGRSANRGQCAQACRLPYGLLVDGVLRELGEVRYLLSPQDLMAVEQVPELIRAGVSCFKIEGRLKGPEYVALTTQVYRRAVDAAWDALAAAGGAAGLADSRNGGDGEAAAAAAAEAAVKGIISKQQRWDLEQVFARGQDGTHRGLTPGFLEGVRHQRLVRGRSPRHRGVFLGQVKEVTSRGVVLQLQAPLKRGDGVAFDAGRPEEEEPGGTVYEILDARGKSAVGRGGRGGSEGNQPVRPGTCVTVVLGQGPAQSTEILQRISPGDLVWRTKDPSLESRLRSSYDNLATSETRRVPVFVAVSGRIGSALQLRLTDSDGRTAVAETTVPLAAARGRPMVADDVARALGPQLGDATLAVDGELDVRDLDLEAGLFLPASELKSVRRQAVEALLAARSRHPRAQGLAEAPVLPGLLTAARAVPPPSEALRMLTGMSCTRLEGGGGGSAADEVDVERVASGAAAGPSGRAAAAAAAAATAASGHRSGRAAAAADDVCLRVLCRSREQVAAAVQVPWLREVVLDFLEAMGLKEAVGAVRASGRRVVVATPRVLKPDEQRLWLFYLRLGADALLVRSAGMLHQLQKLGGPGAAVPDVPYPIPALEGDFSLNAANVLSASLLLSGGSSVVPNTSPANVTTHAGIASTTEYAPASSQEHQKQDHQGQEFQGQVDQGQQQEQQIPYHPRGGLLRLAPTHDLHAGQLVALAGGLGGRAAQLEAVVHQHLPIFHTEHCVFCRFLSSGNSYVDCGHPCERHQLHLRDPQGADHLVLADMGCRNTVFNAQAQSGVFYIRDLLRAGYRTIRIELVDEQPEYVAPLLEGYRDVILGRRGPGDLWRWLATLPDANGAVHGVEAGSLQVHKERSRGGMKPTAAALKQQLQQQSQPVASSLVGQAAASRRR
ncbi:hypothetical protein Agub_g10043 [Astrephomene gubernaculifera]|uniref:Peptidase U32 collagenase domain-containing protein n=1 Tax=Astrephomene gubernaculifera TaxID=47775 RepID=A0AAD3DU78_9CHLO|nr:hypothetical protein Agub_g10043 [Astrephomene gubernaculifera]